MLIPEKCVVCNRIVWWWNKKEFMEMTPDFGYTIHENCFTKEDYKKELNKWFKDIGLNPLE